MDRPNIILINCDDLGYGDLECYGSKLNNTPYLNKMAEEGILFTDFYMASPVCTPSRGAMMTGCYPPRIGFGEFDGSWVLFPAMPYGLNPKETTIASTLKKAGYATKIIGKWHCGDQKEFLPQNHGFDEYFGLPYSNDMGRQCNRQDAPPLPLIRNSEVVEEQPDQAGLTERYAIEAVEYIRKNKENPFFLYFAHMYVHVPIYIQNTFKQTTRNGAYGGAVECIDWSVGLILNELKKQGIDENTMVIFTSDNGSRAGNEGGSNGTLRGKKGETWEGGMRLPCIVRYPKKIKAGVVCSEVATAMDFLPTFASITGVDLRGTSKIDGKDISSLLFEDNAKSPYEEFIYYKRNAIEAVRKGDYKLHVRKDDNALKELYNLKEDISESVNLYSKHPEIVEDLQQTIDKYAKDIGDSSRNIKGENTREVGKVENAKPLTEYNENHPYIVAMYDMADSDVMSG